MEAPGQSPPRIGALGPDTLKALDQTRITLLGLYNSLTALQQNIAEQQPLPSWSSLQRSSNVISNNLEKVAKQLQDHQTLLSSMVTYPLPQFPGRTQEHILQQMLRTRLEPDVEEWVQQGEKHAQSSDRPFSTGLSDVDLIAFWKWTPPAASRIGGKQNWDEDYTMQEVRMGVENVVTGLGRELKVPEEYESGSESDGETQTDIPLPGREGDVAEDESETEETEIVEPQRRPAGLIAEVSSTPSIPLASLNTHLRFVTTGSTT